MADVLPARARQQVRRLNRKVGHENPVLASLLRPHVFHLSEIERNPNFREATNDSHTRRAAQRQCLQA